MIAKNCVDCEGDLVKNIRKIVGPDVVIGVTFDPHSHLSKKFITFELGLGALDKNTIFLEFFLSLSTASIAFGLRATPLCITPHKSIINVS